MRLRMLKFRPARLGIGIARGDRVATLPERQKTMTVQWPPHRVFSQ